MDMIQTEKIKGYWEEKKNLGPETTQMIDWTVLRKSAKNYPRGQWLAKHLTGICGVGIMLQLWKHQEYSSYPQCRQDKENAEHVILCNAPSANNTWNHAIEKLTSWLEDNEAWCKLFAPA
jgi:hypothetical protein